MNGRYKIGFDRPASDWNEALPVGNGRMGAMVFGGIATELLQLNEDSIWYGGPRDRINPSAGEKLPLISKALDEGRIAEAEDLFPVPPIRRAITSPSVIFISSLTGTGRE